MENFYVLMCMMFHRGYISATILCDNKTGVVRTNLNARRDQVTFGHTNAAMGSTGRGAKGGEAWWRG